MGTINPYFTFSYTQPQDYRFSLDSVVLARRVFETLREDGAHVAELVVLDLCAGCGIVGLDFMVHCQRELGAFPVRTDFLEVQSLYEPYFQKNAGIFPAGAVRFLNINYAELVGDEWADRYDLILCNPPYFHLGHGTLSPSEFKNRCRYFMDSDFETLIAAIMNSLKPGGKAYVLTRDPDPTLNQIGDIRGTPLILFSK